MRRIRSSSVAGIVAAIVVLAAVPAALHAAQRTAGNCTRDQLGVRDNGWSGAAGTIRNAWVFTNLSGKTCQLFGYPDMQLFGHWGRPIPTTVMQNLLPTPTHVRLAPGASATFYSTYSDVSSGPAPCPKSAVVRITAPNAAASLFIPARLQPCRGEVNVSAVFAGVHPA